MKLGISHQRPDDFTDERFRYLRTMGVETLEVRLLSHEATFEHLREIRDRVAGAGHAACAVLDPRRGGHAGV